jgi:benzoylformate decarboxylase
VQKLLQPHDLILLIGGNFFEDIWYDAVSHVPDGARVVQLENTAVRLARSLPLSQGLVGDLPGTLAAIASGLETMDGRFMEAATARNQNLAEESKTRNRLANEALEKQQDVSPMAPVRAIHEISEVIPDDAIIVDESITASLEVARHFDEKANGDYHGGRGGGIGQGIAGALGVQVANPDRRVIALSGDGSAMYSIQALWTAAHHQLPVIFVILSNREYRVLKHNLDIYRARFDIGSNKPYPHMDLTNPVLGFPELARGMGVEGETVTDPGALGAAMERALGTSGPYLIEVVVSGKP